MLNLQEITLTAKSIFKLNFSHLNTIILTHSELYSELCIQFEEYRGEYDWLDKEIDGTLDVAHRIIFSAPRDDFFSDFTPT